MLGPDHPSQRQDGNDPERVVQFFYFLSLTEGNVEGS